LGIGSKGRWCGLAYVAGSAGRETDECLDQRVKAELATASRSSVQGFFRQVPAPRAWASLTRSSSA
jgi:hypothetical protein